jgi:hypothetical protein
MRINFFVRWLNGPRKAAEARSRRSVKAVMAGWVMLDSKWMLLPR